MSEAIRRFAHAIVAADRLGNPLHVLRRRIFGDRRDLMMIVDKASGIRCVCNVGSYHIFGETWYSRVYDVPGLPIRPGDVVFDVGANQGFFTCYAASKGAIVYAFEPVPEAYERLVQNIERNGFGDRVTALQCAVSDRDGPTEMVVSESHGGGDSTINLGYARRTAVPVSGRITVECKTFSKILDEYAIPSIRLCKIDVEGSELAMLSTLKAHQHAQIQGFAMEYHAEAYDLRHLVTLLLGWGTHQVCLMNERPHVASTVHLISNQALESWFESENGQWSSLSSLVPPETLQSEVA